MSRTRFGKPAFNKERKTNNKDESVFYDEFALKEWLRELRIERTERIKPGVTKANFNRKSVVSAAVGVVCVCLLAPSPAFASIENMMSNLQGAILNVLAPMVCIGGIIFNGFKLAMGDESAKRALFWSCVGTVISFTAPSILSFLQTRVAS